MSVRWEPRWQVRDRVSIGLWPVSIVFRQFSGLRRWLYQTGLKPVYQAPVPVIVVGNISVGGTGKTPLVAWLSGFLKQAGYRPGIVSRGYRGQAKIWPQHVTAESDPWLVGDEPVWLADNTGCPVFVAPDRPKAVQKLLKETNCNIIISDDGLQHYALGRAIEIAVIDGERGFGNGFCLPAGPLREPVSRLQQVDFVVINGDLSVLGTDHPYHLAMPPYLFKFKMALDKAYSLLDNAQPPQPLSNWAGQTVHAVAGIGFPHRFFQALKAHGLKIIEHPFADHHRFTQQDLRFGDNLPVLMTSKDAVKCRLFACERDWCVPVQLTGLMSLGEALLRQLKMSQNRFLS